MFAIPIASRQARETCRRPRAYHTRWIVGCAGLLAIVLGLYIGQYSQPPGLQVFGTLACLAYFYCLLAGVIVGADVISSERREETLGLLFLTDLRPRDVLIGKFLGSSTIAIFGLLAFIPFLAIPQMMGGVTTEHFLLLTLQLLNTLFLSIAWGLLVSTILMRGWAALCAGIAIMLALGIGYPICRIWFSGDVWEAIDFFCPSFGLATLITERITQYESYWESVAYNHLCAWGLLAMVALRLVYIWRDPSLTAGQQRRRERFRILKFGNRDARKKLRKHLLDRNPLAWLANRDYVSSSGLLALCLFAFGGIIILWTIAPDSRTDQLAFLSALTLILAHLILFFRICIAAAYQLSEDRKSGALELLLSTPLSVSDLLRGRWLGLARQFFGPALIIGTMHLLGLAAILVNLEQEERRTLPEHLLALKMDGDQTLMALLAILFICPIVNWIAAGWLGMWLGLRCKSSATAVWITVVVVLVAPWLAYFLALLAAIILLKPFRIDSDFFGSICVIAAFIFGLGYAGVLMRFGRTRLRKYFRTAAGDRFHAFKIPFPWRPVIRLGGGVAIIVLAALVAFEVWSQHINRRGAQAWAQAVKAFPQLAEASPNLPVPNAIPKDENLAYAPLLAPLNETNRFVRHRNDLIRDMPNPFAQSFPAPTNRWLAAPNHIWNWRQGELVDFEAFRIYCEKRRVLTNVTATGSAYILAGLEKCEPIMQQLEAAEAARPHTLFAHATPQITELSSMISLHALARLRMGDAPVEEVRLILRLAEGVQPYNPTRHGALMTAFQPIFEGIGQHRWNDAQLVEFETLLATFDLWPQLERDITRLLGQALQEQNNALKARDREDFFETGLARFSPPGFIWEAKAKAVQCAGHDIPMIVDLPNRRLNGQRATVLLNREFKGNFQTRLYNELHEFAQLQTRLDELRIACALERFRLDRHQLPERLTELEPAYIDPLPHDIFRNEPLIYQLTPDRQEYVLFTVGWENHDHLPTTQRASNGDREEPNWPWRSKLEIKKPAKKR